MNKQDNEKHDDLFALQQDFLSRLAQEGKSQNTLKNYKTDLECFNQYLRDKKPDSQWTLAQLENSHVWAYGEYLQARYRSDNSRRRRVQALRRFFDYLVSRELFNSNPVKKIPPSPKFLDIPRPTSFVDLKTLWQELLRQAMDSDPMNSLVAKRNTVAVSLIFGAGLRVSDLAQLTRKHISSGENPRVLVTPQKRESYSVPLFKSFSLIYRDYIQQLDQQKTALGNEFVFFNANAHRILASGLSARGLELVFEDYKKRLLIELTPKSLRQACIFKWLHQQHSDALIREWMGVSPSYSLKLYKDHLEQHFYREEALDEIFEEFHRRAQFKH